MGAEIGMHMNSHIYLDPAALLEEVAEAAETLTHGLTGKLGFEEGLGFGGRLGLLCCWELGFKVKVLHCCSA